MKRSKKLYTLLGILVVVCVITLGVTKYEEKKEQIKNSDEIILEVSSDAVTSLSWEYDEESLAFHKDESWIYDEDEAFPVNEEKINELLADFEEFGVSFVIEEVEDYAQYGLDEPVCTINIGTEEETYEIQLGDFSTMDEQRYISIGDGNVYLAAEDPMETFEVVLSDMIQHDETPAFDTVNTVEFAGTENYQIVYEEESDNTYCADDVYFTEQNEKTVPLDTTSVNSYLSTINGLDPTDYVTYNASEEELETYGMDAPELTVSVEYSWIDEETEEEMADTFVLHVSRNPEDVKAAEEKESEEDESEASGDETEEIPAYVRVGESQIIYQITSAQYEELMAVSYDDLRHQEVLTADFADITQIDITLEGEDYTITCETEDDETLYYYEDDEISITSLNSALMALTANSFTNEEPEGKEEISLVVYLDNENYPEISIELYRCDGSNCLAVVDGEPVCLVSRTQVVDLIEAVNAIVLN